MSELNPDLFNEDHRAFRDMVAAFLDKEVVPYHDEWEAAGVVDREVWRKAGEAGLLGFEFEEEFGGQGIKDFRYNAIINQEMAVRGVYGCAFPLFNDMVLPYLVHSANEEQKKRWFPKLASGEYIAAIAMTEPEAGSDLQGIRTTAVDKGDHFVVNGQKTFISNGILADLIITVVKTDPTAGHKGISLLVIERGMEGFERGRNLDKIGQHAQDTAELFFDNVVVPKENLLGEIGGGFMQLMINLSQERLSIALAAVNSSEKVLATCLEYAQARTAFGKPIGKFQHNRFMLAEMATETKIARVFLDDCLRKHLAGELDPSTASMAKWWTTEMCNRHVNQGVQLHGGYGYMMEYPIAKAYLNARIQTIYGGTTEIQKEIIGKFMGL